MAYGMNSVKLPAPATDLKWTSPPPSDASVGAQAAATSGPLNASALACELTDVVREPPKKQTRCQKPHCPAPCSNFSLWWRSLRHTLAHPVCLVFKPLVPTFLGGAWLDLVGSLDIIKHG
uniref:Uncharacterized protein n=1 Tax=Chlamydomonas euryale TaxID=1486919 RepID=A0A7R9VEW9_9CHLO|mmetsp:Transcript_3364/g.9413  ORF Transcript_3364/g.9413 Transcript_3364/m.9413 type:complete len:120 (+) Transcript_3364:351-710(+)